ncbi:hypothetical protein WDW86_09155 [Bdellovibrionota bacterium FG-2]
MSTKPIPYCIEVAAGFPLTKQEVKGVIAASLSEWKKAFEHYGVESAVIGRDHSPKATPFHHPGHFLDGVDRALIAEGTDLGVCPSNTTGILRFQVGFVSERVGEYLKTRDKYIVGAAIRDSYDPLTLKAGGIVWVAPQNYIGAIDKVYGCAPKFPDWTSKRRLQMLMVHELGHVFGVPHDAAAVMASGIYYLLVQDHLYKNFDVLAESNPEEMFGFTCKVESKEHPLKLFSSELTLQDSQNAVAGSSLMEVMGVPAEEKWSKMTYAFARLKSDAIFQDNLQIEIRIVTVSGGEFVATVSSSGDPFHKNRISVATNQFVSWMPDLNMPGLSEVPLLYLDETGTFMGTLVTDGGLTVPVVVSSTQNQYMDLRVYSSSKKSWVNVSTQRPMVDYDLWGRYTREECGLPPGNSPPPSSSPVAN